jgi:hypothetical protein
MIKRNSYSSRTIAFEKHYRKIRLKPALRVEATVSRLANKHLFAQKPQITVMVNQASGP